MGSSSYSNTCVRLEIYGEETPKWGIFFIARLLLSWNLRFQFYDSLATVLKNNDMEEEADCSAPSLKIAGSRTAPFDFVSLLCPLNLQELYNNYCTEQKKMAARLQ